MRVAIHQPEFLPWLGFFDKALRSDTLVILDTVQFRKNYFQNRNRIRTRDGIAWLTIPVKRPLMVPIRDVNIDTASPLRLKSPNVLEEHFRGTPFFDDYFPELQSILTTPFNRLVDLNLELLRFAFRRLSITTATVTATELQVPNGERSTTLLQLCEAVGASTYLSGISGKEYLDQSMFERAGIEIEFQDFRHPIYSQRYEPFVPCMSVVDVFFSCGTSSANVVRGIGVERLEQVFL